MLAALIIAVLTLAHADPMSARPTPCSVGLAKMERQIARSKTNPLEGPTAPQAVASPPADICHSEKR